MGGRGECGYSLRMKTLVRWLLLASVLLLVAYLYPPGVSVTSFGSAMIAAFVIRHLQHAAAPAAGAADAAGDVADAGLFLFVINALMFWAAANVLDGFRSPVSPPR